MQFYTLTSKRSNEIRSTNFEGEQLYIHFASGDMWVVDKEAALALVEEIENAWGDELRK